MRRKIVLAAAALLLSALAWLRPVYTLKLAGQALPGEWSLSALSEALDMSSAAAEEIIRAGEMAEPDISCRLSLRRGGDDALALAREILAATPGVQRAWRLSVDGVELGCAGDLSALSEAMEAYIAEAAPPGSVSASVTGTLRSHEVYIPSGRADELLTLMGGLRSLTRVSYMTADGERIYA